MENAELTRQTAEKLDEMERLLNVSRALSSTIELGPLLRTLLEEVTRTAGADSAGVWLADAATGELEPFAGYHVTPALVDQLAIPHPARPQPALRGRDRSPRRGDFEGRAT